MSSHSYITTRSHNLINNAIKYFSVFWDIYSFWHKSYIAFINKIIFTQDFINVVCVWYYKFEYRFSRVLELLQYFFIQSDFFLILTIHYFWRTIEIHIIFFQLIRNDWYCSICLYLNDIIFIFFKKRSYQSLLQHRFSSSYRDIFTFYIIPWLLLDNLFLQFVYCNIFAFGIEFFCVCLSCISCITPLTFQITHMQTDECSWLSCKRSFSLYCMKNSISRYFYFSRYKTDILFFLSCWRISSISIRFQGCYHLKYIISKYQRYIQIIQIIHANTQGAGIGNFSSVNITQTINQVSSDNNNSFISYESKW